MRYPEAGIASAATGNPDQPGLKWPAFGNTKPTMMFEHHSRIENDPAGAALRAVMNEG